MSDKRSDRGAGGYLSIVIGGVMLFAGLFLMSFLTSQSDATRPMLLIFGSVAIAWGLYENLRAERKPEKTRH